MSQLCRIVLEDVVRFPKESPPDDLLLWHLIGDSNILMSNGEQWKTHSRIIRNAVNQTIPIHQFALLARRLFSVIGARGTFKFDDLSQRYALDAVGTTAFGHDFNAIAHESDFVRDYNHIMHGIANPIYLVAPFLERVFPRRSLRHRMDVLSDRFRDILGEKRGSPGADMMTFMLQDVNINEKELRDNMVLLFIAGHVGHFISYIDRC